MATLLTHAVVAATLGQTGSAGLRKRASFWTAAVVCAILPDIDVIGFRFGVHYGDLWGHRGMTHSLLFAVLIAGCLAVRLENGTRARAMLSVLLFGITASHGVLDALTNGGLGVAFFSPFDTKRYFFPWRPIPVSPIGMSGLFSLRVMQILLSEITVVWVPAFLLTAIITLMRNRDAHEHLATSPSREQSE